MCVCVITTHCLTCFMQKKHDVAILCSRQNTVNANNQACAIREDGPKSSIPVSLDLYGEGSMAKTDYNVKAAKPRQTAV